MDAPKTARPVCGANECWNGVLTRLVLSAAQAIVQIHLQEPGFHSEGGDLQF
jgi:hypothetical protein